jgi:hypothetical protein
MQHAKATNDNSFKIIVRYRPMPPVTSQSPMGQEEGQGVQDVNRRKNSLKGYGVEMVLKRTDYLAVDDRDTGTGQIDSQCGSV